MKRIGPWVMWLWKSRKEFIYRAVDYDGLSRTNKALEDMEEWAKRIDHETEVKRSRQEMIREDKWSPPLPPNWQSVISMELGTSKKNSVALGGY